MADHDFAIASGHKLIPSVYGGIEIGDNKLGQPEAVGYRGYTYVAIRSAKHSSSSADTHAVDFERLFELEGFKNILYSDNNVKKPILMLSVDGGPDKNPRFHKVIKHAIQHFIKHDYGAVFVFTNAPRRSAFNRVERRMAPLSRELTGVVLEYEHYGEHLDSSKKTKNLTLEKKNFSFAGETLANIWNKIEIDGRGVLAEYIELGTQESSLKDYPSEDWYLNMFKKASICYR